MALFYRIEWRPHVEFLDETVGTRLHERKVALVIGDATDDIDGRRQNAFTDFGNPQSEILLEPRADLDASVISARFCILGHQLHVHERGLAGLFEFLLWNHRVVPVQRSFLIAHDLRVDLCWVARWRRQSHMHAAVHAQLVDAIAACSHQTNNH